MSVNQFVNLVKEMRKRQKEFMKTNAFVIGLSKNNQTEEMEKLEKSVDKAISDREKRLFDEEVGTQNLLF